MSFLLKHKILTGIMSSKNFRKDLKNIKTYYVILVSYIEGNRITKWFYDNNMKSNKKTEKLTKNIFMSYN